MSSKWDKTTCVDYVKLKMKGQTDEVKQQILDFAYTANAKSTIVKRHLKKTYFYPSRLTLPQLRKAIGMMR